MQPKFFFWLFALCLWNQLIYAASLFVSCLLVVSWSKILVNCFNCTCITNTYKLNMNESAITTNCVGNFINRQIFQSYQKLYYNSIHLKCGLIMMWYLVWNWELLFFCEFASLLTKFILKGNLKIWCRMSCKE